MSLKQIICVWLASIIRIGVHSGLQFLLDKYNYIFQRAVEEICKIAIFSLILDLIHNICMQSQLIEYIGK